MQRLNTHQAGQQVEQAACQFLQAKGFKLIAKNYRCHYGEIDLIMRDHEDIVFVEVRSRHRLDYGSAFESINHTKQKKLIKTATRYLQTKGWLHKLNSRFDVVVLQPNNGQLQLEWVKNAFCTREGR